MGCSGNKATHCKDGDKEKIEVMTENLIDRNLSSMRSQYKAGKKIGEGKWGKIFQVTHLSTKTQRALKIVSAKTLQQTTGLKMPNEILILQSCDHPSIIKLYEYYIEGHFIYVVLEHAAGRNLSDLIMSKKLTESIIASFMKEVFSCLIYLHSKDIIYRNIKPENVIIINDNNDIKLIGFSSAIISNNNNGKQYQSFGNFFYSAPEVLKNASEKKSDTWSCGVLLYFLLTGGLPFYHVDNDKAVDLIKKGSYDKSNPYYVKLSSQAKDLIEHLLMTNPNKRIDDDKILSHPWFNEPQSSTANNEQSDPIEFKNFTKDAFKTAIEAFIIHQMENTKTIDQLRKSFKKCDTSGDGLISREELKKMIDKSANQKYSDLELNELMDSIDIDKSGKISFEEFLRVTIDNDTLITKQNMLNAFNFFDKDKSGKLSVVEIHEIFGKKDNKSITSYIEKVMKKYDKNDDGQLDFDEFVTLMSSSH